MSQGGQFDDDQGPAWSILLDDDRAESQQVTQGNNQTRDSIDMDQSPH